MRAFHSQRLREKVHDERHLYSNQAFEGTDIFENLLCWFVFQLRTDLNEFLGLMYPLVRMGLVRMTEMAGPARDLVLMVEVRAFDVAHHLEHLARLLFGR